MMVTVWDGELTKTFYISDEDLEKVREIPFEKLSNNPQRLGILKRYFKTFEATISDVYFDAVTVKHKGRDYILIPNLERRERIQKGSLYVFITKLLATLEDDLDSLQTKIIDGVFIIETSKKLVAFDSFSLPACVVGTGQVVRRFDIDDFLMAIRTVFETERINIPLDKVRKFQKKIEPLTFIYIIGADTVFAPNIDISIDARFNGLEMKKYIKSYRAQFAVDEFQKMDFCTLAAELGIITGKITKAIRLEKGVGGCS